MFHALLSKTGSMSPVFKDSSDKVGRELHLVSLTMAAYNTAFRPDMPRCFWLSLCTPDQLSSQTGSGNPIHSFSCLRNRERKKMTLERKQLFATVLLASFSSETSTGWSKAQLLVVSDQLSVNSLLRIFLYRACSSSASSIPAKAWTHLTSVT